MVDLSEFELTVLTCTRCRELNFGHVIQYYPVLSFGDPRNKPLLVVGLNPSTREYTDNFLSDSIDPIMRYQSQLDYFKKLEHDENKIYTFFRHLKKFFEGDAQSALKWNKSP